MKVTIGVSARHVHLNKKILEVLFGVGYELTKIKDLNQPGQFAALETVTLKTEKKELQNVRVLGPVRDYVQVEISKSDAFTLGIHPPVRDSGDVKESEAIMLIGPRGKVLLKEGCILATRHIHITKEEMIQKGLYGKTEVMVKIDSEKGAILDHVKLKEAENSYFELHLDTDDANALLIENGKEAEIIIK